MGYWLGSELVINSTYRHVSWASSLSLPDRNRLMDHVMHVDQHVRYALVLQFALGFKLVFLLGYLPGGKLAAMATALLGACWLVLVELTHRLRKRPVGTRLATLDRGIRYLLMIGLVVLAVAALLDQASLPSWLAWKLVLFAAVMSCGVGIRLVLMRLFVVWKELPETGSAPAVEETIRSIYWKATSVLYLLWVFVAGIVWLSVTKPF
jgi:hypothetical protein